jgi:hypothetical protein
MTWISRPAGVLDLQGNPIEALTVVADATPS